MAGIRVLDQLLCSMQPDLLPDDMVFCTVPGPMTDYIDLHPLAMVREQEGLTVLLTKTQAEQQGWPVDARFRQITLNVHSSLEAVGLTAAVATCLAEQGISANVIAAYYHDHIFVPSHQAEQALAALQALSQSQNLTQ